VTLAIVLTVVGLFFVVAEVFFPSFGMFGLIAAGSIVAADWVAWNESATLMWVLIGAQVVLVPLLVRLAFQVLPRLPFGRSMILPEAPAQAEAGVEAARHLLGREGTALTDLRPSGTAQLGDERRTVVAEMGVVARGSPVTVVAVEGYRIVVRPTARGRREGHE
jgi:membrane-bound serine protease (ClpP class)